LPAANSVYPPPADSNENSGIHAASARRRLSKGFNREVEKVQEVEEVSLSYRS
jgi:hypothetical protein